VHSLPGEPGERADAGVAPGDAGWLPRDDRPLVVEVSPCWSDGARPGDWRNQAVTLWPLIEARRNRVSQTASRRSAQDARDKSGLDVADVAQVVLLSAVALREFRLAFMAWLERDRARRINLAVSDGTRTGTLTIDGGPLSDEAFQAAIRLALDTATPDREASNDGDG